MEKLVVLQCSDDFCFNILIIRFFFGLLQSNDTLPKYHFQKQRKTYCVFSTGTITMAPKKRRLSHWANSDVVLRSKESKKRQQKKRRVELQDYRVGFGSKINQLRASAPLPFPPPRQASSPIVDQMIPPKRDHYTYIDQVTINEKRVVQSRKRLLARLVRVRQSAFDLDLVVLELLRASGTAGCVQVNATSSQFYHSNVAHLNDAGNTNSSMLAFRIDQNGPPMLRLLYKRISSATFYEDYTNLPFHGYDRATTEMTAQDFQCDDARWISNSAPSIDQLIRRHLPTVLSQMIIECFYYDKRWTVSTC
jgi:hypothetical protein